MITIFIKDCNITEIIQPKNYFLIAYLLLNKEIQNCQILPSGFATCFVSLCYCLYCSFSWVVSNVRIGSPGDSLLGRHHYAAWVSIWLLVA